jgi:hypothetical protein
MIENVIGKLRSVADFRTECEPLGFSVFEEAYARLLTMYPRLAQFTSYLEFLRLTGGAFVDTEQYSLVIYGFGGEVAVSFEEPRLFLDRGRYFHFADFVRPVQGDSIRIQGDIINILAFDLCSDSDVVYVAEDGIWLYEHFADSFCIMLKRFADGAV